MIWNVWLGGSSRRIVAHGVSWPEQRVPSRRGYRRMFDPQELKKISEAQRDWENRELKGFLLRQPETRTRDLSASGLPVKRVYTAADIADMPSEDIGLPGRYPYTLGPYPTMYRG